MVYPIKGYKHSIVAWRIYDGRCVETHYAGLTTSMGKACYVEFKHINRTSFMFFLELFIVFAEQLHSLYDLQARVAIQSLSAHPNSNHANCLFL